MNSKRNLRIQALRNNWYDYIYIYKTQCVSVCLSAIEVKLDTFRYKQTYESYITFLREAKYGILISIRIVFGGYEPIFIQLLPNALQTVATK